MDDVDDLETYEETLNAFNLLGFNDTEKDGIFKIIGSILHLGNIKFKDTIISIENEQDQEGCCIPVNVQLFHFESITNLKYILVGFR